MRLLFVSRTRGIHGNTDAQTPLINEFYSFSKVQYFRKFLRSIFVYKISFPVWNVSKYLGTFRNPT